MALQITSTGDLHGMELWANLRFRSMILAFERFEIISVEISMAAISNHLQSQHMFKSKGHIFGDPQQIEMLYLAQGLQPT